MPELAVLPAAPGTYVLIFHSAGLQDVQVGRLAQLQVHPGFYLYVGSARGAGGLHARIRHHCRQATKPHWHVDYLRLATDVEAVWYVVDGVAHEHAWAAALLRWPGIGIPMLRFGASDCRCPSHLFHLPVRPLRGRFEVLVGLAVCEL